MCQRNQSIGLLYQRLNNKVRGPRKGVEPIGEKLEREDDVRPIPRGACYLPRRVTIYAHIARWRLQ